MRRYERKPVVCPPGPPAMAAPDAWAFSPARNFGCGSSFHPAVEIYEDYPTATVWQPDVYAEAADIAAGIGAEEVVDFGCGSGQKLRHFFPEGSAPQLVGVDFKGSLALARQGDSRVRWVGCNLGLWSDLTEAVRSLYTGRPKLLIASDVIEHLRDPRPLLGTLRQLLLANPGSRLLVSTPERYRLHGERRDAAPTNRCHVREWRLEELEQAVAASGFVVERRGYTRSNLEDDVLRTFFLELSAAPEACAELGRRLVLGATSPKGLVLAGQPGDWEVLLQTLFCMPDLAEVTLPHGSAAERTFLDAAAAGLLPAGLRINGQGVVAHQGFSADAAVLVVAEETRLSSLTETMTSINSQSVDPREIVVLVLGTRLDYRLLIAEHLRGLPRSPYRLLHLPRTPREEAVDRVAGSMSASHVAVVDAGDILLNDFLETATRFLSHSPDANRVTLLADPSSGESLPVPDERLPVVLRRSRAAGSRAEALRRLPASGCLLRRRVPEPPHGVARALLSRGRATLWRLVRG